MKTSSFDGLMLLKTGKRRILDGIIFKIRKFFSYKKLFDNACFLMKARSVELSPEISRHYDDSNRSRSLA